MTWEEINKELFGEKTNERFIIDCNGIFDVLRENRDCNDKLTWKELCKVLNVLYKENQELIQSSKELEEDCESNFNKMSRELNELYRKNFKLKEENEALKQKIKELELLNDGLNHALKHILKTDVEIDVGEWL